MLIAASNNIVSRCVHGRKCDDRIGGGGGSSCSFGVLGRKMLSLTRSLQNMKNDESDVEDFVGILLHQLQECGKLDFELTRDNLKGILVIKGRYRPIAELE
ncbi:hypothetical protein JHK85_011026 [Glycine max]|nr:hypothetical protein JHK85_011026 [Glycine max]